MPTLYPVAGCKIYIGPAVDLPDGDVSTSDFSSTTWTQITGWETMGAIGDASQIINVPTIERDRNIKIKGTKDAGSMQSNFVVKATDTGQLALIAAEQTKNNFPFKIELNDKPAVGSAPKNSLRYFYGLVVSAQEQGGNANTARMLNSTIEINSNIVRVAASAS